MFFLQFEQWLLFLRTLNVCMYLCRFLWLSIRLILICIWGMFSKLSYIFPPQIIILNFFLKNKGFLIFCTSRPHQRNIEFSFHSIYFLLLSVITVITITFYYCLSYYCDKHQEIKQPCQIILIARCLRWINCIWIWR